MDGRGEVRASTDSGESSPRIGGATYIPLIYFWSLALTGRRSMLDIDHVRLVGHSFRAGHRS
jgi:hypothetical protein